MKKIIFLFLISLQTLLYGCAACQLMTPSANIQLHIDVKDKNITTIHVDWIFTNAFIDSLLLQYDTNRDSKLDNKEILDVKKVMLEYLLEHSMLTEIEFAKNAYEDEAISLKPNFSDFSIELKEESIIFSYNTNLDIALQNDALLSFVFNDRNGFFTFKISDIFLNSKTFTLEENLYLFTASIVFKDKTILAQKSIKERVVNEQIPQKEQTQSLQTNLLEESIQKVKSLFESIKDEKNPLTYISLLLFAYLYGLIHALGPGHGKTLVASYFLSNERSYSKALFVSLAIGVVHTFSAFLLTLIIYFGVNTFLSQFMQESVYLTTKISALMIISIALYLLYTKYKAYRELKNAQKFSFSATPHVATCACNSCKVDSNSTDIALIISAGIIPCPGTTTIFIFALSLGLYYAGFLSALVMSLGMSTIIYVSALISVSVRKKTAQKNEKLKKYLEYASLIIILLLGFLLLLT